MEKYEAEILENCFMDTHLVCITDATIENKND